MVAAPERPPPSRVARLSFTPVKSMALQSPSELELGPVGARDDRRFFLVSAAGRLYSGVRHGWLVRAGAAYDGHVLTVRLPDGTVISDEVTLAGDVSVDWEVGYRVTGRLVAGPIAPALSAFAGQELHLVRADDRRAAWSHEPVSLISSASIRAVHAGGVDPRRFRMLLELDAGDPFTEDAWIGRRIQVGEAILAVHSPCRRCATVTHSPETGVRDFDALRALIERRGRAELGVFADVERPGRVRLGDTVREL